MFLLSLDEIDRIKRLHGISSNTGLAAKTGLSRKTWSTATSQRKPTAMILDALADLGASPAKVLVAVSPVPAA